MLPFGLEALRAEGRTPFDLPYLTFKASYILSGGTL